MRWVYCITLSLVSIQLLGQYEFNKVALKSPKVENISDANTEHLEFSPHLFQDGMVYVTSASQSQIVDKKINESYFELAFTNIFADSVHTISFSPVINAGNEHIGPVCFDRSQEFIYFTKSQRYRGKRKKSVNKIYTAELIGGLWTEPVEFVLNSDEYSVQHPALSSDGSFIVFSSNMPGGHGGYDLYISYSKESGWSPPVNLGTAINSFGNELFPSVYENHAILFSSSGRGGVGELDVFISVESDSLWNNAINLGKKVNSKKDDLGFVLDSTSTIGYFSSNRKKGKGKDDLYAVDFTFPLLKKIRSIPAEPEIAIEYYSVMASVSDDDGNQVDGVSIKLLPYKQTSDNSFLSNFDVESIDVAEGSYKVNLIPKDSSTSLLIGQTNSSGQLRFGVANNLSYILSLTKSGYQDVSVSFDATKKVDSISIKIKEIEVTKSVTPVISPTVEPVIINPDEEVFESRDIIIFDQIYYEFNSANIHRNSTAELDKLADYLNRRQDQKVELTAHTDSRGNRDYNLILSTQRAESAKNYLLSRGIDASRISAYGKGESAIRNHCTSGVYCTEKEHEYNRRTEVRIID